ncbi:DUF6701 domain-containing protein [Oceanisphaera sp. KMM 10153]|uniref:DUF6701 domain-containing protein n=1 Tax=Oceanisphaera submarina TaxID=3390193 RepID=UPI003976DBAA
MKIKYCLLSTLLFPFSGLAADIDTLFPYAAQSHNNNGEIDMEGGTVINGTRNESGDLDFIKNDDLKGRCDGRKCKITGDITPNYSLPGFNDYPFSLPEFKTTSANNNATCRGSGNITYSKSEYNSVSASGSCDIHLTNDGDVVIRDEISASGSADLYLEAGNYWMDSFSLSGSSKVIITTQGEVNLYVRDKVNLTGGSPLGSVDLPVNLIHYGDDDIELAGSLTWYGNLSSMADLTVTGSSKLYGAVQARSLKLGGSSRLYQTSGDYWFEDVELGGSSRLIPTGDGITRLYVRDELELEGSAELGLDGQSLLVLVYGDQDDDGDDGDVDLAGSSDIYGHLYIQGDLEMGGSTRIYGAVNVVDLEMEGSSAIHYRELEVSVSDKVHHYELHFNSCSADLTVKACGDATCSSEALYKENATVHVKNQRKPSKNIYKFKDFQRQASRNISSEAQKLNYYFELGYQSNGNGNLNPKPDNDLVCYVDGEKTCMVNGRSGGGDSGELRLIIDTAYAGGKSAMRLTGACLPENGETEVLLHFDSNESGSQEAITLSRGDNVITLSPYDSKALRLPVSGAFLSYPVADVLTVSIQQALPEGDYGKRITDSVAFVPKSWQIQKPVKCSSDDGFNYEQDADNCTVLAHAGDTLYFGVSALDINEQLLPLAWLSEQKIDNSIKAEIKNPGFRGNNGDFAFNADNETISQHSLKSNIVGLLEVAAAPWVAGYIPEGDSKLTTEGDIQNIGRTVPAVLQATAIAGDVEGDVIYAGKPGVNFITKPSFTVEGLDVAGKPLPSYSGGFAGGLKTNGNVQAELETMLSYSDLTLTYSEPVPGQHLITLNPDKLKFIKDEPFAETALALPLALNIVDHDGTSGLESGTSLGQAEDKLRYGFLTLADTEVKVGEAGQMTTRLNYFDTKNQLLEDKHTDYSLSGGRSGYSPVLDPALMLGLDSQNVVVAPYDKEQKGIKVVIEELDTWLRPDRGGELVDPEARLDILTQPRRRANDSTFNRREVIH